MGAYIRQSQFSSSKSVKTRETILFAISLTGMGAYLSQSHFSWTQYSNTKLDLKSWTSQFSSSKSWKTRQTILLAIILTGIGAYKIPTQLTYYKRIKTSKTKLEHKTWKNQFSSSKDSEPEGLPWNFLQNAKTLNQFSKVLKQGATIRYCTLQAKNRTVTQSSNLPWGLCFASLPLPSLSSPGRVVLCVVDTLGGEVCPWKFL